MSVSQTIRVSQVTELLDPVCLDNSLIIGKPSMEETRKYVEEAFQKISGEKEIYSHFTTATDTKNVDRVFESCMDIVFKGNVGGSGLA